MIEVRTRLDGNTSKALMNFSLRKMFMPMFAASAALLVLGIVWMILEGPGFFSIFFIAFGALFLPLVYLLSTFQQRNVDKSQTLLKTETYNDYLLSEEGFSVEMTSAGQSGRSEIRYDALYAAYETGTHFFLYLSKVQAHVLPKCDFVSGTPEELSVILAARTKFKRYR